MQVKNVPMVFDIEDNYWEKIFIENARFENISAPAFNIAVENNSNNSITLRNVWCSNVPVLAAFKRTGEQTAFGEISFTDLTRARRFQKNRGTDPCLLPEILCQVI